MIIVGFIEYGKRFFGFDGIRGGTMKLSMIQNQKWKICNHTAKKLKCNCKFFKIGCNDKNGNNAHKASLNRLWKYFYYWRNNSSLPPFFWLDQAMMADWYISLRLSLTERTRFRFPGRLLRIIVFEKELFKKA